MGLFREYATDRSKEKDGIEIEIRDAIFIARRRGSANKQWLKVLQKRYEKWNRVKEADIPLEERQKILLETFVDTVLIGWRNVTWPTDPDDPDSPEEPLKFTRDNAIMLLTRLDELYEILVEITNKPDAFRLTRRDAEAGN